MAQIPTADDPECSDSWRHHEGSCFFGMTTGTSGFEMPGFCTPNWRHMFMLVISLQWVIAGRVAIHTTRMGEKFPHLVKDCPRAIGGVRDRHKLIWTFEFLPGGLLTNR
jgi:hypothetical protein